jgi:hypothetical protein
MRVLVCGSRDITQGKALEKVLSLLHSQLKFSVVIEGECRGADTIAREWAEKNNISVEKYPADWKRYKYAAGPIRNQQMIDEGKPALVIAFYLNKATSKGTANMVKLATKAGLCTLEYELKYGESNE